MLVEGPSLSNDDEATWRARGKTERQTYLAASPWPHITVTNLFDPVLIAAAEIEELPRARGLAQHISHLGLKAESSTVVGPAATALFEEMCSPAFIGFIEELTGIFFLQPDRSHHLSGLHVSGPGGHQSIHRDFFRHPVSRLWHRVDVLVYLNSDWSAEYGGDLELWEPDMSSCRGRVAPSAGTTVIFETNYASLHGVPDPVRCPPERRRLSLATYYYSNDKPPGRVRQPFFRSPRRPQDPWWTGIGGPALVAERLARPLYRRSPERLRRQLTAALVARRTSAAASDPQSGG